MIVKFRTKRLEKCYLDVRLAYREFGKEVGTRFVRRIALLRSFVSLNDSNALSGLRCHQLKGERAGQWAINLDRFNRLIFTLVDGSLEVICIEEVSKHYGD